MGTQSETKKVVLIGPPNSGKTSIVLTTFGYVEPQIILRSRMEPTRGIDSSTYDWDLLTIGVFDLAGQEIQTWMTRESDWIFPETDEILAIFECNTPIETIIELLKEIYKIVKKYEIPYFFVLIHKMDLLLSPKKREDYLDKIRNEIDRTFGIGKIQIFGTSIFKKFYKKYQFTMDMVLSSLEIKNEAKEPFGTELKHGNILPKDKIEVNLNDEALAEVPENISAEERKRRKERENETEEEEIEPQFNNRTWKD